MQFHCEWHWSLSNTQHIFGTIYAKKKRKLESFVWPLKTTIVCTLNLLLRLLKSLILFKFDDLFTSLVET